MALTEDGRHASQSGDEFNYNQAAVSGAPVSPDDGMDVGAMVDEQPDDLGMPRRGRQHRRRPAADRRQTGSAKADGGRRTRSIAQPGGTRQVDSADRRLGGGMKVAPVSIGRVDIGAASQKATKSIDSSIVRRHHDHVRTASMSAN